MTQFDDFLDDRVVLVARSQSKYGIGRRLLVTGVALATAISTVAMPLEAAPVVASPRVEADTILRNADIYTESKEIPRAGVVAIKGQKFVYVGDSQDNGWRDFVGSNTKVVDLRGRMVIPGMTDAHTHPASVVLSSYAVTIPWTRNLTKILEFLKKYASEHPASEVPFIRAQYYPSDMKWGPNGPAAAAIDAYVSDRPVIMEDWSGHSSVANSKALQLMGVDKTTPLEVVPNDPAPQFVRGADGVTPTGFIYEAAWLHFADRMYKSIHWSPPATISPALLATFTDFLSSKGVTSLLDAASGEEQIAAAAALDQQGKLNMNYHASLVMHTVAQLPDDIRTLQAWQQKYGGKHIEAKTIKLFLDGTNEIGTSAVLEPFVKGKDDYGKLRLSEADLVKTLLILNGKNLDLHIHVLGDRGFRTILDAVAAVQRQVGKDWRMRVTAAHADLIDPADMARVAKLGVIVNWTPHWGGGSFGDAAAEWLGYERFDRMTQFNPIIKSGGLVTFSSDVVSGYEKYRANPFFGMQTAHTRIDPTMPMLLGSRGPVRGTQIRPPLSARLLREDLLTGYTRNGAFQLRLEDSTGTIAEGKMANLAILNENLFKVPANKIRDVVPIAVVFEGRVVNGDLYSH